MAEAHGTQARHSLVKHANSAWWNAKADQGPSSISPLSGSLSAPIWIKFRIHLGTGHKRGEHERECVGGLLGVPIPMCALVDGCGIMRPLLDGASFGPCAGLLDRNGKRKT